MGLDGERDEGRADDTEHELELGFSAERRCRRPVYMGMMGSHPRLHGGTHRFVASRVASGREHLFRNGDFEDGVQTIFSVKIWTELPHGRN